MPAAFLYPGKPTGAATPLVWAHAEFVKLAFSLADGRPVDQPVVVARRYGGGSVTPTYRHWSRRAPIGRVEHDKGLRLILEHPARIHWKLDGGSHMEEITTEAGAFDLHYAEIRPGRLAEGKLLQFTIIDPEGRPDDRDISVVRESA